jgi:hypothetical protein
MSERETDSHLSETSRKEIFQALVEAQDRAVPVPQSRQLVADRFGVSINRVREIEREGLANHWPPLS